ncbi:monovalent cation/H+ antiporter complex subunit F [Desulfurococcus mucosus]|uniref:Multiple resistance and pH regulation protein F n=1 Tax=Desulfurococcus mucosus (strain ATCC 35584 / DSM 2162 / JCM 9187 / O7/1) TaxID=765177 RepID=E8R9Y2_DESM0|nr:monovalent cation/H+ antiporter complex subunit F [Desulfurococcus mucosus]ADV65308.1 multiple resistance and pH regulation protein F [Desulfurococcus mucosus DSM 2162]
MVDYGLLESAIPFITGLFTAAMILYSLRVLSSKTLPDAVLAVDALSVDLVVLLVLIALYYKSPMLLIGVVPLAAWILLLDVIIARYMYKHRERGGGR